MPSILAIILGIGLSVSSAWAGFSAEPVVTGLSFPVAIAFDGKDRLFFTERFSGQVRVITLPASARPQLQPNPVFRFGPVSGYFERGLLGLALDPEFRSNGYLYAYYSHKGRDRRKDPYRHRLMRITVRDTPKGSIGTFPTALLDRLPIGSQSEFGKGNHNGGSIAFGPDQKLYLTIGDLASPGLSQDLDSFAGKILRLDADGSAASDNPFYDPKRPEAPRSYVYAIGLRNSFDFTFGPGPEGEARLFATENGPATNDELNIIEPGGNYGWDKRKISGRRNKPGYVEPILVYERTIAPTGIAFYSGKRYPESDRGKLFFADWNEGRIRRVTLSREPPVRVVRVQEDVYHHTEGIVDLVMGPDGWLYFTTPSGIYRLVYDDTP